MNQINDKKLTQQDHEKNRVINRKWKEISNFSNYMWEVKYLLPHIYDIDPRLLNVMKVDRVHYEAINVTWEIDSHYLELIIYNRRQPYYNLFYKRPSSHNPIDFIETEWVYRFEEKNEFSFIFRIIQDFYEDVDLDLYLKKLKFFNHCSHEKGAQNEQ